MIDKWLALRMVFGRVEHLGQHLLDKLHVRARFEAGIKREQWSRELKAVASQLELVCCVDVRHLELNAGTVRGLAEPQEEISLFVLLEEHQVVATQIEAKIAYNLLRFLAVDLGLLLGVGKQACEISDEMPHPASNASRTHHQCSLPVLPLLSVRLLVLESPQCLPSVKS